MRLLLVGGTFLVSLFIGLPQAAGADWPMFGRDRTRNPVSLEKDPPLWWRFPDEKGRPGSNIKWQAKLGGHTKGDPVVADGLVWVGTITKPDKTKVAGRLPTLMCF